VVPRWDADAGAFISGSATIRDEFLRLVETYGAPAEASAVVAAADPDAMPADDIRGYARDGAPDLGAYELGASGDGDGDPGDGDGDPTTGDGDGDPATGDGDGDPSGSDGTGESETGAEPGSDGDAGCSCSSDGSPPVGLSLVLLALLGLRRGRSSHGA
jgi:MYXO-CTERM domain-containing protein